MYKAPEKIGKKTDKGCDQMVSFDLRAKSWVTRPEIENIGHRDIVGTIARK